MPTEKLDVEIEELLLDQDNPRTGHVNSQAEALAAIVRLSAANFRNMMRSIKDHGLDPGDSFYLVQLDDESEYTVVDGNRRLAALKVLKNPSLLKGTQLPETIQRPLLKEAEGFKLASDFEVSAVLFENREDAGEWIERRHGRGLEGEGRIAWGAFEIQRFQNDRSVLDVIDFVEKNSTFSDDEWSRIKGSVVKNTSTLKRFLDSKPGKTVLGYEPGPKEAGPTFSKDPGFVLTVLSQVAADIDAGAINSRTHNTASDIAGYFDLLPADLKSKGDKTYQPKSFATEVVKDGKERPRQTPKANPAPPKKEKKTPPPRRTLAPVKHPFAPPQGEKGKQLLREAARLKVHDTPLSAAFCFRAVIEYTVDTYMKANSIPAYEQSKELNLQQRLDRVFTHLVANGKAKNADLAAIKTTLTNGPMSVGALNGFIHNSFQMPTADNLIVAWEHGAPFFTAVFGPAK